jgi:hypothetical protein
MPLIPRRQLAGDAAVQQQQLGHAMAAPHQI